MGDQLYVDVWAPKPLKDLRKGLADKYERYWGDGRLPGAARRLPDLRQLRRPRVLERLPRAADPGPVLAGSASRPTTAPRCTELYDAYQAALNPGGRRWTLVRRPAGLVLHRRHALEPHPRHATRRRAGHRGSSGRTSRRWADGLKGPGVLVLPQPLLKAGGSKTDRTLVDFKESDRLGGDLRARARRRHRRRRRTTS